MSGKLQGNGDVYNPTKRPSGLGVVLSGSVTWPTGQESQGLSILLANETTGPKGETPLAMFMYTLLGSLLAGKTLISYKVVGGVF